MTLGDLVDYLVWMSLYELSDFSGSHRQERRKNREEERRKKEKREGEGAGGGDGEEGMKHLLLLKSK